MSEDAAVDMREIVYGIYRSESRRDLSDYRLAHAARADLCRQLGKHAEARESRRRALVASKCGRYGRYGNWSPKPNRNSRSTSGKGGNDDAQEQKTGS